MNIFILKQNDSPTMRLSASGMTWSPHNTRTSEARNCISVSATENTVRITGSGDQGMVAGSKRPRPLTPLVDGFIHTLHSSFSRPPLLLGTPIFMLV